MQIWEISVKRPVFMSCVLVGIVVVGLFAFTKLPVDLFPDVTFPIVTVTVPYPGAGPNEVETLIAKPLEEELSGLSGVKNISSINSEGVCTVVTEFTLETDVKYAEQQVRDHVSSARRNLPNDILEPTIRRIDPADQPLMVIALQAPLKPGELYDLANERIKTQIEQVANVGRVTIVGGREREIQVLLDRNKLFNRQVSVSQVAASLQNSGVNTPSGKIDQAKSEVVFRTLGEFNTLDAVRNHTLSFFNNETPIQLKDLGEVKDSLQEERSKAYINGKEAIFLNVYRQSKANTIEVSDSVQKKIARINTDLLVPLGSKYQLTIVQDTARYVRNNVEDVYESIGIGVVLTILVVFFFLGSVRSTLITGLSIPVSLIGGMSLFYISDISINIMSLLALSLAVGLLIDDAIVVRENIFRHMEMGKSAIQAALDGTREVGLAVIAVTLCILAVFGPIAFLSGVVGQFFKSFGLGVCFVMMVSLFDALSNAPMLSAYFGGSAHSRPKGLVGKLLARFDRFQTRMENGYSKFIVKILRHPWLTSICTVIAVILLGSTVMFVPKTFIPAQENGEFSVTLEMPRGTKLSDMDKLALSVDQTIKNNSNVTNTLLTVGNENGKSNVASYYVRLLPFAKRSVSTAKVKEQVRASLKQFAEANPIVKDYDAIGGGQRPFTINFRGENLEEVRGVTSEIFKRLQTHPAVLDPEITDKPGLPEFQVRIDDRKAQNFGVTPGQVGGELRAQVEGLTPAKFRQNGLEYDIRVRLADNQRDLEKDNAKIFVPNINRRLVALKDFSTTEKTVGVATINRENRARYIGLGADVAPNGPGMGAAINDIKQWLSSGEVKLPPGVTYRFVGQAENFQELAHSVLIAAMLAVIFIFLVLASLYESVVTPFVIMLVIPLAIVGGFFGLFIFHASLNLFSMIGCVMLMGLATKNSIILVDYIQQKIKEGLPMEDAIREAGRTRLRPILMTSIALIAGMIPIAVGLNEASSQRTALGIAVIGGVTVSNFLTLLVIPSVYSSIENGRLWMIKNVGSKLITANPDDAKTN